MTSEHLLPDTDEGVKLPFSTEVEESVISCLLIDPKQCVPICRDAGVGSHCFHFAPNGVIYDTCVEIFEESGHLDAVLLAEGLKKRKLFEVYGGTVRISELADLVPSAAALSHYLPILLDMTTRRNMIKAGQAIIVESADQGQPVPDLMERFSQKLSRCDATNSSATLPSSSDLVKEVIDMAEAAFKNGGMPGGLPTGIAGLDDLITGMLQPGNVYYICGRPSMGKSSLAMQIALRQVLEGVPVGVVSLEMSSVSLMQRAIAHVGRMDLEAIINGKLTESDFTKFTHAGAKLSKAPLYIDDRTGITVAELRARARRMSNLFGIRLLVIDYLQLLLGSSSKMNELECVSEASKYTKIIAKQLGIPVIALVQMNRDIERGDKVRKPKLSDLRSSGQLEQDADLIGALWDPTPYEQREDRPSSVMTTTFSILKQRNGPLGDVPLVFLKSRMTHEALTRQEAPEHHEDRGSDPFS